MKFFVLGCNGMAGHMVSLYLKEQGHDVTGYARRRSRFVKTVIGDARDFDLLKTSLQNGGYDAAINCVGLLNRSAENDRPLAVLVNGYLPHFLAKVTEQTGTKIIHMSTDCVFSGKTGGYTESSVTDGAHFYGRSKAVGELRDGKNITLRNSVVGPDPDVDGIGLLNWFLKREGPVDGYRGAVWTGQTSLQLAKTMEYAAGLKKGGLFHAVPAKPINKYELLKLFNRYIRREPVKINPVDGFVTDKSLVGTDRSGFACEIPDYETMVRELGDWMRGHRELYPHYDL